MKGKNFFFEESVELHAYPPEYIFSEKYEAIIYLDEINGRMKDYYDCFKLIEENILNVFELKQAVNDTFTTRGTELGPIPDEVVPILDTRWDNFLAKEKISNIEFQKVVDRINSFLKKQNVLLNK